MSLDFSWILLRFQLMVDGLLIGFHLALDGAKPISVELDGVKLDFYRCWIDFNSISFDFRWDDLMLLLIQLSLIDFGWNSNGFRKSFTSISTGFRFTLDFD